MKILIFTAALALASLPPSLALAKNDKLKHGSKHQSAAVQGCPPGLAKKNNGCRPPGQAKKARKQSTPNPDVTIRETTTTTTETRDGTITTRTVEYVTLENGERYRVGDRLNTSYRDLVRVIDNPDLFDLAPVAQNRSYVRVGDTAVMVDNDTREVLALIALANLLID